VYTNNKTVCKYLEEDIKTHLWSSCNRVFTNQIGFVQVADEKPTSALQI